MKTPKELRQWVGNGQAKYLKPRKNMRPHIEDVVIYWRELLEFSPTRFWERFFCMYGHRPVRFMHFFDHCPKFREEFEKAFIGRIEGKTVLKWSTTWNVAQAYDIEITDTSDPYEKMAIIEPSLSTKLIRNLTSWITNKK